MWLWAASISTDDFSVDQDDVGNLEGQDSSLRSDPPWLTTGLRPYTEQWTERKTVPSAGYIGLHRCISYYEYR